MDSYLCYGTYVQYQSPPYYHLGTSGCLLCPGYDIKLHPWGSLEQGVSTPEAPCTRVMVKLLEAGQWMPVSGSDSTTTICLIVVLMSGRGAV